MKITIDGRVHVNGALLKFMQRALSVRSDADVAPVPSTEVAHAIEELIRQDELAEDFMDEVVIVGHPSDDLPTGMVLLSCGPVAIECDAGDLRRAMMAFLGGVR